MKKLFRLCLTLSLMAVANACTVKQAAAPSPLNHRVVERDLTKAVPQKDLGEEPERGSPPGKMFVIHFEDGSAVLKASGVPPEVLKHVGAGDEVLVVGHSHGSSDEKSSALSAQRAMAAAAHLQKLGAKKVYLMASWGPLMNPYDPTKGVQVFIMKGGREPARPLEAPPEKPKADEKRKKI